MWTYGKIREDGYQYSLLDLLMIDKSFVPFVAKADMSQNGPTNISSDHVPLIWQVDIGNLHTEEDVVELIPIFKTNWNSFRSKLNALIDEKTKVCDLTVSQQSKMINKIILDAYNITSALITNIPKGRARKKLAFPRSLNKKIIKKKAMELNLKRSAGLNDILASKIKDYKALSKQIDIQIIKIKNNKRNRFRSLLKKNKPKSAKIFWDYLKGSRTPKPKLPTVLLPNGILSSAAADRKIMLDKHFKEKFSSVPEGSPILSNYVDPNIFSDDCPKFGDKECFNLLEQFTHQEIVDAISTLKTDSAPGLDKITNNMLKNITAPMIEVIKEHFNCVLASSVVPTNWKEGLVTLLLKRTPATILANYRPITLISCISKLFTKMIAKRLSISLQETEILGDPQHGFRADRCCQDNILILNTLLEQNKNEETHLAFVDLTAAYDMVDRNILWAKLKHLNIPSPIIQLLQNYYNDDSIICTIGGITSDKHYLRRGLRQGCNLSPVLFSIYISDLSFRLNKLGKSVNII